VLEEQGLLTARGKTMVVYGVRPRLKGKAAAMSLAAGGPAGLALHGKKATTAPDDEEDEDEDDED
jgi:hypothetical protein